METPELASFGCSKRLLWSLANQGMKLNVTVYSLLFEQDEKLCRKFSSALKIKVVNLAEGQGQDFKSLAQTGGATFISSCNLHIPKGTLEEMVKLGPCYAGAVRLVEPRLSQAGEYGTEIRPKWLEGLVPEDGNFLMHVPSEPSWAVPLQRCYGFPVVAFGDGWPGKQYRVARTGDEPRV